MITREKQTLSGPLLELDFYPVFSSGRAALTRAPKSKRTDAAQARYNKLVARKKLIRLVNANFNGDDYFMHPTFSAACAPKSEGEARNAIVNYLRRVKRHRAAELRAVRAELAEIWKAEISRTRAKRIDELSERERVLSKPFRYAYVIEQQVYKTGEFAGLVNWHYHLFCTGGLSAREMEKLWHRGVRVNCSTYKPEDFGPEAAARYMAKAPEGSKRFVCSRNMEKPRERVRDGKISQRTVERMATLRVDDREFWEKRYKGYKFLRCYTAYNEYNGGWYVSAVMYRDGDAGAPPWKEREWIEDAI